MDGVRRAEFSNLAALPRTRHLGSRRRHDMPYCHDGRRGGASDGSSRLKMAVQFLARMPPLDSSRFARLNTLAARRDDT